MLTKIFPFLAWFQDYDGGKFKVDLLAGITVAMVLIPQSMAYAQLAGLPAYYGLYAAFLPPMVAALFRFQPATGNRSGGGCLPDVCRLSGTSGHRRIH